MAAPSAQNLPIPIDTTYVKRVDFPGKMREGSVEAATPGGGGMERSFCCIRSYKRNKSVTSSQTVAAASAAAGKIPAVVEFCGDGNSLFGANTAMYIFMYTVLLVGSLTSN